MTTANKISVFRILLVPVFVRALLYYFESREEVHRYLAVAVFALAAASDWVDGYIARRFNQRTELGTILDPIGDKLLLMAGMVLLTLPGPQGVSPLPLWLAVTAISRAGGRLCPRHAPADRDGGGSAGSSFAREVVGPFPADRRSPG